MALPPKLDEVRRRVPLAALVAAVAFLVLYWTPLRTLVHDWWNEPEAGHGLLLGPLALWFAWRRGLVADRGAWPWIGAGILVTSVLLRYAGGLAAEMFTLRFSLLLALIGLTIFLWGVRQVVHWWLPLVLLALSLPLPQLVIGALALPLQLQASEMGAAMLAWRDIPVHLAGNVIHLPGQSLFVTEACSGLRSLTALLALGVLIAGIWLRSPWARALLIAAAIPVAIVINGVRVFMTGFLVHYVDPALGRGFMHMSEGFVMFGVAFAILGALSWLIVRAEEMLRSRRASAPSPAPRAEVPA